MRSAGNVPESKKSAHHWVLERVAVDGQYGGRPAKVWPAFCMRPGCKATASFPVSPEQFGDVKAPDAGPCLANEPVGRLQVVRYPEDIPGERVRRKKRRRKRVAKKSTEGESTPRVHRNQMNPNPKCGKVSRARMARLIRDTAEGQAEEFAAGMRMAARLVEVA